MYERRFGLPRAGIAALWIEGQLPKPASFAGRHDARPMNISPLVRLRSRQAETEVRRDDEDTARDRDPEGAVPAGERRPPRLGGARPVLRELARVPRGARRGRPTTIYAAAASEWHGSAVWRSSDRGETWEHSSEGLAHDDDRKISKVASASPPPTGACSSAPRPPGIWESTDGGETWSKLTTLEGQPGREEWDDPANQPPGHLGISALMTDAGRRRRASGRSSRASASSRPPTTVRPGRRGTAACAPTGRGRTRRSGSASTGSCARPPTATGMYQQNHVGMHRSDDLGHSWTEITEGLPSEFGFAAAAHPHDRGHASTSSRSTPSTRGRCPTGRPPSGARATPARRWRKLDERPAAASNAHLGVLRAAMTIDDHDVPGLYFGTSTGQLFASADEGESWSEIASYLPAIWSVEVATVE